MIRMPTLTTEAIQETFLRACEGHLPTEKYNEILNSVLPFGLGMIESDREKQNAAMRLRNDFGGIEYTSDDSFDNLMHELVRRNSKILDIGSDNEKAIIRDMIRLLREIFGEQSEENPVEYNQALHALAKLVLANPAEFIKIFIQLTPGDGVTEKIRYLYGKGINVSSATIYRDLDKKAGHKHTTAMEYLELLVREKYPLGGVKIEPCDDKDCVFGEIQAERMAEVERILDTDKDIKIRWNIDSIRDEIKLLTGVSPATMYRWLKLPPFSTTLALSACNNLPTRREEKRNKFPKRKTISSINPESL